MARCLNLTAAELRQANASLAQGGHEALTDGGLLRLGPQTATVAVVANMRWRELTAAPLVVHVVIGLSPITDADRITEGR